MLAYLKLLKNQITRGTKQNTAHDLKMFMKKLNATGNVPVRNWKEVSFCMNRNYSKTAEKISFMLVVLPS